MLKQASTIVIGRCFNQTFSMLGYLRCLKLCSALLHTRYGLIITTEPHLGLNSRTYFQKVPHRCNYVLFCRWNLNNSGGGVRRFFGHGTFCCYKCWILDGQNLWRQFALSDTCKWRHPKSVTGSLNGVTPQLSLRSMRRARCLLVSDNAVTCR